MHDFYQSGRDRGHKERDVRLKVTTAVNGRGGGRRGIKLAGAILTRLLTGWPYMYLPNVDLQSVIQWRSCVLR